MKVAELLSLKVYFFSLGYLSSLSQWATHRLKRGYLLFGGEYQIYFIEYVENLSNFTSA